MFTRLPLNAASFCLAFGFVPLGLAQGNVPGEVDTDSWESVRAIYDAGQHAVSRSESGYVARNAEQGWLINFDSRSFLVEPVASAWSWGLELESYGFAGSERFIGDAACVTAEGGRVSYAWDDSIEEWYVNDTRGFEHGFTMHERPLSNSEDQGPLKLALRVRGDLIPTVQATRRGITFASHNGSAVVTYSGLTVFDADGLTLDAWFERTVSGLNLLVSEREARYPLTIDPVAQQAYLKASNPGSNDAFGFSTSISGDTLVVGAFREDSAATGVDGDQTSNAAGDSGAAYVFVRSGSTWSQQAYLKASNTGAGDMFGSSVSISGDTLVVGAFREDSAVTGIDGDQASNTSLDAGAAYVFVRSGSIWSQQAYLKASNTDVEDRFGTSVSISGDTLVVAAQLEDSIATGVGGDESDNSAPGAGAAYVFVRTGTVWSQQAYVKASNTDVNDAFGQPLSLSGDTLVAGAKNEDSDATGIDGDQVNNASSNSGAAYVFSRSGSVWSQEAYLKASVNGSDLFGSDVAVSGDTIVVAALVEGSSGTGVGADQADNGAAGSGAAYVFVREGLVWSQQTFLKASNADPVDFFGQSVAIFGDVVAVGAASEDSSATGIDGDQGLNNAASAGAVYVFAREGSLWGQVAYVKASNTESVDGFGYSVAVSDSTLVVGADGEDSGATGVDGDQLDNTENNSGAAYVFDLSTLPVPYVSVCNGDGGDQMGCTNCPCMNNAAPGRVGGCLTSIGSSIRVDATGDASVSLPFGVGTDLRLTIEGAVPNGLAVMFSGDAIGPANPMAACFGFGISVPLGNPGAKDGLRCAVGNLRRHGNRVANNLGNIMDNVGASRTWGGFGNPHGGLFAQGGFVAGQTRFFQATMRENPMLGCMTGLQSSNAVKVTFLP